MGYCQDAHAHDAQAPKDASVEQPPETWGEGRNRTPNVLLTVKIDMFFRLINHYTGTIRQDTFTTPLLALPLAVDLLTYGSKRWTAAKWCSL